MQNKKGFSIIEVLFSLLVLSIGIVSILVIVAASIKSSILAKNQIIAAELVQEGIELARNLNDNKDSQLVVGSGYRIDKESSANPITLVASSDYKLNIKAVEGNYSHAAGDATRFYRKIDVADDGDQRTITSTVVWNAEGTFPLECTISNECVTANSIISY